MDSPLAIVATVTDLCFSSNSTKTTSQILPTSLSYDFVLHLSRTFEDQYLFMRLEFLSPFLWPRVRFQQM